jgi:hypothetical protein
LPSAAILHVPLLENPRHLSALRLSYIQSKNHEYVLLMVELCEVVAADIDVSRRWLGEQGRRGLSFSSDVIAERLVMQEVTCELSVVGSLLLLIIQR